MKIYYCDQCGKRVPEEDLESGKALVEAGDTAFCAECVIALDKSRPQLKRPPTRGYALPGRVTRATGMNPRSMPSGFGARTTESAVKSASLAHLRPASSGKPNYVPHLVLGGLAIAILFGASFLFSGPKKPETHVGSPGPVTQTPIKAPDNPTPPISPPTPPKVDPPAPRTGGLFDDMQQEHNRELSPEFRKAKAASKLGEAKEFRKNFPQDPWKYLDMLRQVPDRTPAGDEAAKEIAALAVPSEKSGTAGWYRDWEVANDSKEKPPATIMYDYEGRQNVLKAVPPIGLSDLLLSRKINIPANTPVLECSVLGGEKADGSFSIEVDGKMQVLEPLTNDAWKTVAVDLKPLAGKVAEIVVRHAAGHPGEAAYWTELKWVAAASAGTAVTQFKTNTKAFSRIWAAVAARAANRKFVGSAEWVQPSRFKSAINLLALADVKGGARDSEWKTLDSGGVQSTKCRPRVAARLEIDFVCPPEYDVKAVVERKSGNGDAGFVLFHPPSNKQFLFTIAAADNKFVAIADANGKRFDGNPAALLLGQCLDNNRKYTLVIEVRNSRISAYLDGHIVTEWTPDMGALQLGDYWKLKNPTHIGVGTWQSEMIFHSCELSEAK